jgi:hypothetical protein
VNLSARKIIIKNKNSIFQKSKDQMETWCAFNGNFIYESSWKWEKYGGCLIKFVGTLLCLQRAVVQNF